MKLFIKHLFRGILYRPLQPIILILTLSVSLGISLVAMGTRGAIEAELAGEQSAAYGDADLTVSQNSTSASRFMFPKDVESVLEGASAVGVYELPMYHPVRDETLFGAAVEFSQIGKIFSLSFSEYHPLSEQNVSDAIFLSRAVADSLGIGLGDQITVQALGYEKVYTVFGISELPFLSDFGAIVDIRGIVKLLAEHSVLVSALGEEFRPASTIYIKLPDGLSVATATQILSQTDSFSGKTFTDVAGRTQREANADVLAPVVDIAVLCSSLLSLAIGFACLYILSRVRSEENAAFIAAGARPLYLYLFQYGEMLVYLTAATAIGIPVSTPILRLLTSLSGFRYADPAVTPSNCIAAVAILLLTGALTVTAFIVSERLRARTQKRTLKIKSRQVFIASGALLIPLLLLLHIAPPALHLSLAVVAVLVLLLSVFLLMPTLLSRIGEYGERIKSAPLSLALKNIGEVKVLHNAARLVALITALTLILACPIQSSVEYIKTARGMIDSDLLVLGATDRTQKALKNAEGIGSVSGLFVSTVTQSDGSSVFAIGTQDIAILSDTMGVTQVPAEGEVIISKGQAVSLSLSVGDSYEMILEGERHVFSVKEITRSGIAYALFDSEALGLPYNMLAVCGNGELTKAALRESAVSSLALEVGTVSDFSAVMKAKTDTIENYVNAAKLLLLIVILFTLIGLADNLYESYRSRREEFSLFSLCGASRSQIRQMKLWELLITLALGALVGLAVALPSILIVFKGLIGNGDDLFINFLRLF